MKAYRGCRGTSSLILNSWTTYSHQPQDMVTLLLGKESSIFISELESELDGAFWRKEKSLAPATNQTPDHPACSPVIIPPILSHLLKDVLLRYQQNLQRLLVPFHISVSTAKATVPTVNPEAQTPSHIQF